MEEEQVVGAKKAQPAAPAGPKPAKGKLKKHYTGQPLFDDVLRGNVCNFRLLTARPIG